MAKRDRWAERRRGVAKRARLWATAEYEASMQRWGLDDDPHTAYWAESIPREQMIAAIAARMRPVLIERAFIGSRMTERSGY
jgi:hypothetical protein